MNSTKAIIIVLVTIILAGGFMFFQYVYNKSGVEAPPKTYKVGVIVNTEAVQSPNVEGFKAGMSALGYQEGANIEYIYRHAQNNKDLQVKFADEIVSTNPDAIVLVSPQTAAYLKSKNLKIPLVFMDSDPGPLVKNPDAPEANITGVRTGFLEYAGKRVEMLKEMDASVKKIIVSPEKKHPNYASFMRGVKEVADKLNIEIVEIPSEDIKDFVARAPKILNKKNGDAFIYFPGPNNNAPNPQDRKLIIAQLIKEKILSITHIMEFGAKEGVLASYGIYRTAAGKEAAYIVDQILKGKPIKEIPVADSIKSLNLELNLKTAKEIGITIPQAVLSRANKVYQE